MATPSGGSTTGASEMYTVPVGRTHQPDDAPQQGGLAAAGRPDDGDNLAGLDVNS